MQLVASYPDGTDSRMHLSTESQGPKIHVLRDGVRVACVEIMMEST